MSKPKQASLFNFFRGKSNFCESDVQIKKNVKNTINTLITTIEKNENAAKISSKRKPVRNTLDSEMTEDKIKQWKNDFTFWDTKDGKVCWNFDSVIIKSL